MDSLQTHCKVCNKERARKYYKENRSKHLKIISARNKAKRTNNQEKIFEYLLNHSCVDCGEKNPLVLDFDHISNKKFGISYMISNCSWESIVIEIKKCEVRCKKCHSIKTHRDQNSYRWKMVQELNGQPSKKS